MEPLFTTRFEALIKRLEETFLASSDHVVEEVIHGLKKLATELPPDRECEWCGDDMMHRRAKPKTYCCKHCQQNAFKQRKRERLAV